MENKTLKILIVMIIAIIMFIIYNFIFLNKSYNRKEYIETESQILDDNYIEPNIKKNQSDPIIKENSLELNNNSVRKEDNQLNQEQVQTHNYIEANRDESDQEYNKTVICYTMFVNCANRALFFNYPSEEFPWSEEAEHSERECLTSRRNCINNQYQELSPEEEQEITEYYRSELEKKQKQKTENQDYNLQY